MGTNPPPDLVIVSGLKREAAIFAGPDVISVCGGASTLRAKLAQIAVLPARMVVSVGICGGLDQALRCGDIIVGTEVVSGSEDIRADTTVAKALEQRLAEGGERVVRGRMAAADAPVLSAEAKAKLRAATGADAVDMESLIAGRFARERDLPFAMLRVVSDPAHRNLPPLVLKAVDLDGDMNIGAAIAGLLHSPAQFLGLVAAARDSATAFRALGRCRRLPGLFLGLRLTHF
jgi:hopanoid-associated phosphorylase